MTDLRRIVERVRNWFAPLPPCGVCGREASDIAHDSYTVRWEGMPIGVEPVEHWYEAVPNG